MSKLLTTFKKYIFNTFRHVPTVHVSTKRKTLGRRIVISVLVSLIALEHVLVPFAYAEQNTPTPKAQKEQFKTLTTDTNLEGVDPYIGEGRGVKSIIPAITDLSVSNDSATVAVPARVHRLAKEDYRPNEEIKVVIENGINKKFKTELIDAVGQKVALETTEKETGAAKVITINQPSSFRPGKYTLRISDGKGGVSEQDFSWGVLAINPDKSIYAPQENADLAIAVLDEGGNMVCDAQVELQITDPNNKVTSLSTDNGKVLINPECKSHDFTLKPDYETNYQVGGIGEYQMHLKAQTKNGAYEISDSFAVQAAAPFDVKRVTATRIYPPNTYPVTMEITANQDFEGTVTESVPASFRIAKPGSQVLTEAQQVDKDVNASDSGILAPEPQLPNAPEVAGIQTSSVLPFSTVNNLANINGGERAVFGATIPGLGMPFNGPFPVTQEFGENLVHMDDAGLYETFGMHGHDGIDFGMPIGTTIQSVDNGTVVQAGPGGYGTTVVVKHSWGYSYYGHLSEVKVKVGDQVIRGSAIALSGNSGITTGPHLHFSIKPDKNDEDNGYYGKVDPAYYLGMKQSAGVVLAAATKVQPESYTTPVSTDIQVLTWKINVKKGDKIKIGYNYLAPRISPQFYTLGPATFTDTSGKEVFHEIRKWQIAADALDLKIKQGSFTKTASTCSGDCFQSITGLGFKPKAIIFYWTAQTSQGYAANQYTGMGFSTSDNDAQENSVAFWSEDAQSSSDTGRTHANGSPIYIMTTDGNPVAAADVRSFDADGFTIGWWIQNSSSYNIQYTAIGGADVTNAKVGSFTLTTGTGSLAITDPGFKPDFLMTLATGTENDGDNTANAKMSVGYAASASKQSATTIFARDAQSTTSTKSQQRTDSNILLLTDTGTQDAIASLTSFDTNGFTLNKSDGPAANTTIYYLALQGGQYDVGSLTQPTATGSQSVTTGFRPSGVMFASQNATATTSINNTSSLTIGGASSTSQSRDAWCNDTVGITCTKDWSTRKKITINSASTSASLSNFPVLVKLDSSRINYNKTQNAGQDIRFVSSANPNAVLSYEIEKWDESGISSVWVKVPNINPSASNYIWMYYGNSNASDGQDSTNVWDTNFQSVYHSKETSGTTLGDSTTNARNGTKATASRPNPTTAGQIGGAQTYVAATSDWVDIANTASSVATGSLTFSLWFRPTTTFSSAKTVSQILVNLGESPSGNDVSLVLDEGGGQAYLSVLDSGNNVVTAPSNQTSWTAGTWYYLSGTFSTQDGLKLYVNGVLNGTDSGTTRGTPASTKMSIGRYFDGSTAFDGIIDEVRISNTARSADWTNTEYLTAIDATNTYGIEEAQNQGANIVNQGTIWSDDRNGQASNRNANMSTTTAAAIRIATSASNGSTPSSANAEAELQSFDTSGYTLNWTTADATAREVVYWAAGSISASQEDYRWFKNANALTPGEALEDENTTTIVAKSKATARLRASMSAGGNGLSASSPGFKLQYAAAGAESGVTPSNDWCNDTTGVTCVAPGPTSQQVVTQTDWCNDASGITCDTNWQYRRKITINNSASGQTLTDFPLLVKLDSTRIDYSKTQSDGDDLRFVADGAPTVVLPHEIDGTWSNSGTNYVWVKVTLAAGSTTGAIYMYYGNNSATSGQDKNNVWNSAYQSVWHLGETGDNVGNDYIDSTSTANNAQGGGGQSGRVPAPSSAGQIGAAQDFDGTDDVLTTSQAGTYNFSNAFTIDLWINADDCGDSGGAGTIFENWADAGEFYVCSTNSRALGFWVNSPGDDTYTVGNVFSFNTWAHVAVTHNGSGTYSYYVNGVLQTNSDGTGSVNNASSPSTKVGIIGADEASLSSNYNFDGEMDDLRVSSSVRTADWLEAEYLTGTDAMNSFGSEQTYQTTTSSNGGWDMRRKITFDNSSAAGNLPNFPVLVKLDNTRIDYSKTQNSGQDIRFVDPSDPTTVLPHEIETWNESGTSYVWVKVPQIDAGSTSDYIWMYYDNPTVSDGQDATNVWESDFKGVWHLSESGNGTSNEFDESTSSADNGTGGGGTGTKVPTRTAGQIGSGQKFDGVDDYIITNSTSLINGTTAYTYEAWINPTSCGEGGSGTVLGKDNVSNLFLCQTVANNIALAYEANGSSAYSAINSLTMNKWHHVVAVYNDANVASFYIDGVLVTATDSSVTEANTTGGIVIGTESSGGTTPATSNYNFDGVIDEARISTGVRSADWIKAEYLTGSDQMNAYSEEQAYTNAGSVTTGWTDVADIWCNDNTGVTCNTNWTTRKRITINNQASSTNLTSFPVLVKLDSTRIDYSKTQNSGQDLRFVDPADPNTVLPHEIERWDESGTSYVWVQVPQLDAKSATDSIWMYYGNAAISDGQAASSVWDGNYKGVWHLNQDPAVAGSGGILDSTTNANNGTDTGSMDANDLVPGTIDGSLDFDGSNDYIQVNNPASLRITGALTISTWVKVDNNTQGAVISKSDLTPTALAYSLEILSGKAVLYVSSNGSSYVSATSTSTLATGIWYHITAVYNPSTSLTMYINGIQEAQNTTSIPASLFNSAQNVNIGAQQSNATNPLDGIIDESRISNTNRSADWVKAEYLTTSDQLNTFGNEETQSSAVWRFKDNTSVSDGTTITSAVLGTSTSGNQMTYQESNPTFLIPTALGVGEKREFDFSLDGSRASNRRTYYFRLVNADGTPMTNYTKYPSITVGVPNDKLMRGGKWFNYKKEQNVSF